MEHNNDTGKEDNWDKTYPDIVKLLDHGEMGILRYAVEALTLTRYEDEHKTIKWQYISLDDLMTFIKVKSKYSIPVDRDLLWKVLWCKSNLQLKYIPKYNAFRWNGRVFEKSGWKWEVKDTSPSRK